jgi:hypothetical protein
MLALLPYMIQRFSEPDEFCLSCAATVGQVSLAFCVHSEDYRHVLWENPDYTRLKVTFLVIT